ncbi:MAG: Type secretion system pilin [Candidatus Parcubacteria bacterium]|jgi:hypothetical protein
MNGITTIRRAAAGAAVLALSTPLTVFAQTGGNPVGTSNNAIDNLSAGVKQTGEKSGFASRGLPDLIGSFVQQAMGLLGIVLVCLVIYAGFLWMTAQGDPDKIKKSKSIITSAVIGLVLIFAAYSITGFVVDALRTANQ